MNQAVVGGFKISLDLLSTSTDPIRFSIASAKAFQTMQGHLALWDKSNTMQTGQLAL